MTYGYPTFANPAWPPPPRRRQDLTDVAVVALAVIIVVLLVAGGIGVAVTTGSSSTSASTRGPVTTSVPGGSPVGRSPGGPPGTPSTTTPSSGVAPVSPLTVAPPASVPPVSVRPLSLPPSVIAGRVDPAVVDVDTRLAFQRAIAEGTGMVLTSSGVVLTNNHVIDGATSIGAVSVGTGRTYPATVLGVDPSADVAVIQLLGASGLPTVSIATLAAAPGDAVVAIGNAGGAGGTPSVTTGNVEVLDQSIIADDPGEGTSEQLNGLIESTVSLQPGDSGGPLVNGTGQIIGMDTAASQDGGPDGTVSFAIPIAQAMAIAHEIEQGRASSTVFLGLPGFLGVTVSTGSGPGGRVGALIDNVVTGGPADEAGISPGELIVSVNGTAITSNSALTNVLRRTAPGQAVTVGWIDATGITRSASVVLASGPAD